VIRNEQLYLKESVLYAANIAIPDTPQAVETLYNQRIREVTQTDATGAASSIEYYEVLDQSGNVTGYVLPASGPGLWGQIDAVVGYRPDLKTLTGVDFTKQNETPGLGARISEAWFREQFRGKSGPFTRVPEGTKNTASNQFDAITGATITSTAVQNILNRSESQAASVVQGGN